MVRQNCTFEQKGWIRGEVDLPDDLEEGTKLWFDAIQDFPLKLTGLLKNILKEGE